MKLCFPVNFVGITNGYSSSHQAIDLGWHYSRNEPILACFDGIVSNIYTDEKFGGGLTLSIKYDNGYSSDFKHLSKTLVKIGDIVSQFQEVAIMGNSGWASKGTHLHFNLYDNGKRVNPLEHTYLYPNQEVSDRNKDDVLYYKGDEVMKFKVGDIVYALEDIKLYTTIEHLENKYTLKKNEKAYVRCIKGNEVALANPDTKEYFESAWTCELNKLTTEEPMSIYKELYEKEILINKDLQAQLDIANKKIADAINTLK